MDFQIYFGLFFLAFVAATILPAQSELALTALLMASEQPAWALVLAAWVGNTLGSLVNWYLGRCFQHLRHRRWFPVKDQALTRAEKWYRRYGRWSLLLSWVPVIGDPITVIAGVLREPFGSFLVIVGTAKLARYLVVVAITLNWLT